MIGPSHETIYPALGRVPSGLFILTARHGHKETGMLASWVQQCSFDPPQVSAAFAKDRWVLDWLEPGTAFAVNVLAEGQKSLLSHFGKGFGPGEAAFDGLEVHRDPHAAPMLLAAHAFLDCRVDKCVPAGDHILVIGTVVAGAVLHDAKPATHVRRTGKQY
ncbi:MAG TPA: flavin reductase family protein [Urbifossiella sp.]|nr:flavin reductase family protein [Urbifossiella sp.]